MTKAERDAYNEALNDVWNAINELDADDWVSAATPPLSAYYRACKTIQKQIEDMVKEED